MNEHDAKNLATAMGGEEWDTGGGVYVVGVHREAAPPAYPAAFIVFSGDAICEYESEDHFDSGAQPTRIIHITPKPRD